MITACTVFVSGMEEYLSILLHSMANSCPLVKNIIAVKSDASVSGEISTIHYEGVDLSIHGLRLFPNETPFPPQFGRMVCGHALGMHHALELATTDLIYMTDPDVFFLSDAIGFFYDTMQRNHYTFVGAQHFNAAEQAYEYFPTAIGLLTRKSRLPSENWLGGNFYVQSGMRVKDNCRSLMRVQGKYLLPGPLSDYVQNFTCPDGIFDMGCNLFLWSKINHEKWLSVGLPRHSFDFGSNKWLADTVYPFNYSSLYLSSNSQLPTDIEPKDLLYHKTGGSKGNNESYFELYKSLFDTGDLPVTVSAPSEAVAIHVSGIS